MVADAHRVHFYHFVSSIGTQLISRSTHSFLLRSHYIPLYGAPTFDPTNNCTSGFFELITSPPIGDSLMPQYSFNWLPGNCEADLFCQYDGKSQALPCAEGYVCPEATTALTSADLPCAGGFVCAEGTTPDVSLQAPQGQYKLLCPAGYYCFEGTGPSAEFRSICRAGFFCPTGTFDPFLGKIANDALFRNLSSVDANPYLDYWEFDKRLPLVRLPVDISAHDERCFMGINDTLLSSERYYRASNGRIAVINLAIEQDQQCGRDHKWQLIAETIDRKECDCVAQLALIHDVFMLYSCTEAPEASRVCDMTMAQLGDQASDPLVSASWSATWWLAPVGQVYLEFGLQLPSANSSYLPARYFRTCEPVWYGDAPGLNESTPATWGQLGGRVEVDGVTYLVGNCNLRGSDLARDAACPVFCSFHELKEWVEPLFSAADTVTRIQKTKGMDNRVDPLLYDLKYAVDLLDDFSSYSRQDLPDDDRFHYGRQGDLLQFFAWDGDAAVPTPLRLDACQCESAVRCPNGTTSNFGSSSIFDCYKKGNEVLRRYVPLPSDFPYLVNASDRIILRDLFADMGGLPFVEIKGGQQLVVTLNLTGLSVNFTFNDHYQVAVYVDCEPCPPRYQCQFDQSPYTCAYPSIEDQIGYGYMCTDCCACQNHLMPAWLNTNTGIYPDVDDKHGLVTITLTAVYDAQMLFCLELLHGQYYKQFDVEFIGTAVAYMHSPYRARYTPESIDDRNAFYAVLDENDFDALALPLNLPSTQVRVQGTLSGYTPAFENQVFVDRPADTRIAHQRYWAQLAEARQANETARRLARNLAFGGDDAEVDADDELSSWFRSLEAPASLDDDGMDDGLAGRGRGRGRDPYSSFAFWARLPARPNADMDAAVARRLRAAGNTTLTRLWMRMVDAANGVASAAVDAWKAWRGPYSYAYSSEPSVVAGEVTSMGGRGGLARAAAAAMGLRLHEHDHREDAAAASAALPYPSYGGFNGFAAPSPYDGAASTPIDEYEPAPALTAGGRGRRLAASSSATASATSLPRPYTGSGGGDKHDFYVYNHYGQPMRFDTGNTSLTQAMALEGSGRYWYSWYHGGSVFYSTSGDMLPANPFLIPPWYNAIDPLTGDSYLPRNYTDTGRNVFMCFNNTRDINWESKEECLWRIANGLTCFDREVQANCSIRIWAIRKFIHVHWNYRQRPYMDITRDPSSLTQKDLTWWSLADPNYAMDMIALPYVPWFSNCDGFDSHMLISKLVEDNPDCKLKTYAETAYVDPYPWNLMLYPDADSCVDADWQRAQNDWEDDPVRLGLPIYCTYEEEIFVPPAQPRWFEQSSGSILFHLTHEPLRYDEYAGNPNDPDAPTYWGRTPAFEEYLGTEALIPITVEEGTVAWQTSLIPRIINFTLHYYQVDRGYKRLVRGSINYASFCTISNAPSEQAAFLSSGIPLCVKGDYQYTLLFSFEALWWLDLLNYFQFPAPVYVLIYIGLGMLVGFLGFVVWFAHRIGTRLSNPPLFRFWSLWKTVAPAPTGGSILVTGPVFMLQLIVLAWFVLAQSTDPINHPSFIQFEAYSGDWTNTAALDIAHVTQYRLGRVGACLVVCGFYIILMSSEILIPPGSGGKYEKEDFVQGDEDDEDEVEGGGGGAAAAEKKHAAGAEPGAEEHDTWTPLRWKRGHLVMTTFFEVCFIVVLLEFSYSSKFSAFQYYFIVFFKMFQLLYDIGLRKLLREVLLTGPLCVMTQVAQVMMIQGADTFTNYVIAYMTTLCVIVSSRIYIEPGVKSLNSRIPKYIMMLKRRFRANRRMTREQRLQEEQDFKRINEEIALETEGIEPLLESYLLYSTETCALVLQPFVQLTIYLLDASPLHKYRISEIPGHYGIRETDLVYYTMFSLVIIPAQLSMDMFLLNTQELAHGWKLYDYVSYQRYRFTQRETRWQLASHSVDASISEYLQTADMLCFSSQYYFVLALHTWGMILTIFGIVIMLRKEYDMFADWVFLFIFLVMWTMLGLLKRVLLLMANLAGLWRRKTLEGTVEDEVAAKLAIGEGTAEDLEAERIELAALNSERFRQRFLERNRPWIIAHLSELLTPRTLKLTGADGRPHIDYVRDVYDMLVKMSEHVAPGGEGGAGGGGDGTGAGGGHEEQLSDSDDEQTKAQRKKWSALPPPNTTSRALLRWWLEKSRRRIMYRKLVVGIMENQRRPQCDSCGKPEETQGHLHVELGTDGHYDAHALDRLVATFEKVQGVDKGGDAALDFAAWKAFFRANAETFMRCDECVGKERAAAQQASVDVMYSAEARRRKADDAKARRAEEGLDSDDDDDGADFEPVTVDRRAPVGRLLAKWLGAARQRIGGVFPLPEARAEMEMYTRKMRDVKARQAERALRKRKAAMKAKEEGDVSTIDEALAADDENGFPRHLDLSATSKALALKWMLMAREHSIAKEKADADELRAALSDAAAEMSPSLDFYYTEAARTRGAELVLEGRRVSDAVAAVATDRDGAIAEEDARLAAFVADRERDRQNAITAAEPSLQAVRDNAASIVRACEAQLVPLRRRVAVINEKLAGLAETSADAALARQAVADLEQQIQSIEVEVKNRADATIAAVTAPLEAVTSDLDRRVAAKTESHARSIREIQAAFLTRMRALEQPFRDQAMPWLIRIKAKIAKRKQAEAVVASNRGTGRQAAPA